MLRRIPTDARAGVGLSIAVRPDSGGEWISLDFVSVGGRRDGHDLTPEQLDSLLDALLLAKAAAQAERTRRADDETA